MCRTHLSSWVLFPSVTFSVSTATSSGLCTLTDLGCISPLSVRLFHLIPYKRYAYFSALQRCCKWVTSWCDLLFHPLPPVVRSSCLCLRVFVRFGSRFTTRKRASAGCEKETAGNHRTDKRSGQRLQANETHTWKFVSVETREGKQSRRAGRE